LYLRFAKMLANHITLVELFRSEGGFASGASYGILPASS
jgi:hypothetical protein